MNKVCKIHGMTKHFPRTDGGHRCNTCAVEAVKRRRQKVKGMAIEYKGGACGHCGGKFHPAVFEFHHRDPSEKDFTLSGAGHCKSWETVKAEIDKCEMLCANCHRLEHVRLGDIE